MENENNNNNNHLKDSSIIDNISKNNQIKLDKEVDDILNEFPLLDTPFKKKKALQKLNKPKPEKTKKKPKRKFWWKKKKKGKVVEDAEEIIRQALIEPSVPDKSNHLVKNKKSNFNIFWPILGLLIIIIVVTVMITMACNCPTCSDEILDTNSAQILADSIQSQIITQGYAEILQGEVTLKLAPYTG